MSADEAAALIQVLSDTLEVPTRQVLVYYMARIPGLWMQAGIWAVAALACVLTLRWAVGVIRARRAEWERRQETDSTPMYVQPSFDPFMDGSVVAIAVSMVSGVLLLLVMVVGLATLQRAVSATVAPEAYAIDAVLRQLRG